MIFRGLIYYFGLNILPYITLLTLSCTRIMPVREEIIKFKLHNGDEEFSETFVYNSGIKEYPYVEHFAKILKEIKNGNKQNINKLVNYHGSTPLLFSRSWSYSLKLTRYLLEQGADPNITEVYAPDYEPKNLEKDRVGREARYDFKTYKMKVELPLGVVSVFAKSKNIEYEYKHYLKSLQKVPLFLIHGAKIKLKDYWGDSALEQWPKGEEGKEFATAVCKNILKEPKIYKFDSEFIDYAQSCSVDETLIEQLKKKLQQDKTIILG